MVVLLPPALDQHLGFQQRCEDLPVNQFIPQLPGEGQTVKSLFLPAMLSVFNRSLQNTFGNTYYESIRHLEASHRTTYTVAALPGTFRFVGLA